MPVGRFPHDAAATGGRVIVGNEMGDSVSVLAGDAVATFLHPRSPAASRRFRSMAAVVSVRARKLTLFSALSARRARSRPSTPA